MSNMGNAHYFSGIHNKTMKQVSKKLIFKPASYVYRWGNSPVPPKIKAVNFKSGKIKGQIRRSKRYSILFDNIGNKAGWNQILGTIQYAHNPFVSEKDRRYITFSFGLNELKNESFSRSESLDTGIYDDFSTERDIIFSASPLASAFCFFNKLVASVVVLVAFALGNGCGGDGQYPYQEQQGGGAEYDFEPLEEYLPEVPLEEEEIHRKNEEICKNFPRDRDYDPEEHFVRRRYGPVKNGKRKIQDECLLGVPYPYENWLLESMVPEMFDRVGLDWKEFPYRVIYILRYTGENSSTQFKILTKYMTVEVGAMRTKSCMESYPEYSQVVFQNGECNGQNPTRNYVTNNDKHIISKTDIDDVHKKNKDICNKISGHNYTRGETEIIDDNNVTFMDGCDVKISKKIWTENVIPELFNRKGLNWTEIPYKIDFILGNPAGGEFGPTFMIIKTKNMNINVTLEKTRSCILRKQFVDSEITILPRPQTSYYGKCDIRQR